MTTLDVVHSGGTAQQVAAASFPSGLDRPSRLLPVPWRDPHSVTKDQLQSYVTFLERACEENPASPDLRTCLGMAYAMDYQIYKSSDALQLAIELDGSHFFARLKYGELHYRLRTLVQAEEETKKALDVAGNMWEIGLARKQLQEIRKLMREGSQKPEWNKPLLIPVLSLAGLFAACSAFVLLWK